MQKANVVYFLGGKTYINLTNACTCNCVFCVRDIKDDVLGASLVLERDNVTADEVIQELVNHAVTSLSTHEEVIFCGYGEPLLKLEVLKDVCKFIKSKFPYVKVRVNTNGHASKVLRRNVPKELKGLVDSISVSLNAPNAELYEKACKPNFEGAYEAMLEFVRQCIGAKIPTTLSVVQGFNIELDEGIVECYKIANELGVKFRIREYIKEGY